MCSTCFTSFSYDTLKLTIILGSLLLAGIFFVILRRKKSLGHPQQLILMYSHIFFLVFPIIFLIYGQACQFVYLSTFFSCTLYRSLTFSFPLALGIGILTSFFIAPFFYKFIYRSSPLENNHPLSQFIAEEAEKIKVKMPQLYLLNLARPLAFSFSNFHSRVFLSVGLFELLSRKELQAVLLHELGHIDQGSSLFKFSAILYKLVSPLSALNPLHNELDKEELKADRFVTKTQGTNKYLLSAKQKINDFEVWEKKLRT